MNTYTLGLAKRDLWGLGAESWFVVASYVFAKMILQSGDHFGKSIAGTYLCMSYIILRYVKARGISIPLGDRDTSS